MSVNERRRGYHQNRVLIETERILDPQFHDAVVFLSGAQIEMLRNITQYLNRQDTYVSEYHPGYYLMPTVADYDDLLEIVADLEETLMGNPNTIWGYKDRLLFQQNDVSVVNGTSWHYVGTVPAGEIWRILGISVYRDINAGFIARYRIYDGAAVKNVTDIPMPVVLTIYPCLIQCVLKEGDRLRLGYTGATVGEALYTGVWGYKMSVPE